MSTEPRREEFSAGGVVVRDGAMIAIVPVKRSADGSRVLGLPKGHPDGDETPEQAAAREVTEETGVTARLIEPLGDVEYRYERKGRPVH
jgi:8-oxo-dGTP pyrophosphatase MutT (NUDIX family)